MTVLLWSSPASASVTLAKLQDAKAGSLTCYRRRSGVRLSKDPEDAQVHGTDQMHLWVMGELMEEVLSNC